jgi:hypothetical protein
MLLQVLRRLDRLRFPSLSRACLQQRFLFFSACKPKKNPKKSSQFFGFGMNTATLRMSGLGNLSRSMRTGRTGRSQVIIPQQSLAASLFGRNRILYLDSSICATNSPLLRPPTPLIAWALNTPVGQSVFFHRFIESTSVVVVPGPPSPVMPEPFGGFGNALAGGPKIFGNIGANTIDGGALPVLRKMAADAPRTCPWRLLAWESCTARWA